MLEIVLPIVFVLGASFFILLAYFGLRKQWRERKRIKNLISHGMDATASFINMQTFSRRDSADSPPIAICTITFSFIDNLGKLHTTQCPIKYSFQQATDFAALKIFPIKYLDDQAVIPRSVWKQLHRANPNRRTGITRIQETSKPKGPLTNPFFSNEEIRFHTQAIRQAQISGAKGITQEDIELGEVLESMNETS